MSVSLKPLLAVLFAGLNATTGCSAEGCLPWTDAKRSFSVCVVDAWYHRTMPSGSLFLCDSPKGACVESVGGGPSPGHATLSLVAAPDVLVEMPTTLEAFAHKVSDKDATSKFSEVVSARGRFEQVRYLVVTQIYSLGGIGEEPQIIHRYFAQAGDRMIELILTYNESDKRAQLYLAKALQMVLSLRPT